MYPICSRLEIMPRPNSLSSLTFHSHKPQGCPDCEMERLQKWLRENTGLRAGPTETVNAVLRLVAGMQERIDSLTDRIESLDPGSR